MKRLNKLILMLLCVLMIQVPVVPAAAAAEETGTAETVTNGWNSSKTSYYKNNKPLTGLQKIKGKYYYFNGKGVVVKNKFKKLTVKNKKYCFYFGKTGAAYKAENNDAFETFKIYKINGKKYGFDADSHRITGIWANVTGTVYYFNGKGEYDAAKSKKLRKLAKYNLRSKTLLNDIKKKYGKPKKQVVMDTCNPFDGYDTKYYKAYVLRYDHIEISITKNTLTGTYNMDGVFPREK